MDLFETMENCRAMRRLKPDPVPDDLVAKILHAKRVAAAGAPTGSERFVRLQDRIACPPLRGTAGANDASQGRAGALV